MICDAKPNFLHYERKKCLVGTELFGDFVDLLFKMKKNGVPGAKTVISVLWGALSKKDVITLFHKVDQEVIVYDGKHIHEVEPLNDNMYKVTIKTKNKLYKSPYARIAPFLMAKGRQTLSRAMKPHLKYIKRVHTDSMLSTIKLPIETSDNILCLDYKGYYEQCVVENMKLPKGEFTKAIKPKGKSVKK